MYNLLVTAAEGAWDGVDYVFDLSRFLEYTDADLKKELGAFDEAARAKLTALPTLFAYEAAVGSAARVGWLRTIQRRGSEIRVTFQFDPSMAPLPPDKVEALAWDLEITAWELSRTHWAVKKVDLLRAISGAPTSGTADSVVPPYATRQSTAAAQVTTLTELVPERDLETVARAVRDAIERNEPASGLDRLHTFSTILVRSLCERRGIPTPRDKSLQSLFGEYVKNVRGSGHVSSEMTERILRSSISVLDAFNDVRNNRSLAHDNTLLNHDEALLIFHHVVDVLRFVQELERRAHEE